MKKIILSMAVAVISMTSLTAMAQKPGDCDKQKCEQKCQKEGKCQKDRPECNPFEGLQLTQEQQTKLSVIPCPRKVMEEAKKQCKGDSTQCSREQRMAVVKDVRTNYLNQVKAVLSPEQYVQFLENNFVNQMPQKGDKMKGDKKKGDKKDFKSDKKKGDKKGQRPDKGQRPEKKNDQK